MTTSSTSPAPEPGHTKTLHARVLWKWSLVAAAVGLMFLVGRCGLTFLQGQKLAKAAVQHFHQQLNAEAYEEIYRNADQGFRAVQTHDQLIKFLQAVHRKLGNAGRGSQVNMMVETNTRGTFIITWYTTAFAGGTATEVFTWTKRSGSLKLYQYHIESSAFLTQ